MRDRPAVDAVPPHLYFVVSAVFHYLGPAFAVLLFARVDVLGVAWLRIALRGPALRLVAPALARLRGSTCARPAPAAGLGRLPALMNACFYISIDRLPLGTVAAIEFLPVIALAALGARSWRNARARCWRSGRYLLTDVSLEGEQLGLAFAFANAVLFALYIVLAHRVARHGAIGGIDALGASMLVAVIAVTARSAAGRRSPRCRIPPPCSRGWASASARR